MALLPKEQAAIDAAKARGLSQKKIDFFLGENPGDYSRLASQQPDDPGGGGGSASAGSIGGLVGSAPDTGSASASSIPTAPATAGYASSGQMNPYGAPALRQDLGRRIPPMVASALAGLKRIY